MNPLSMLNSPLHSNFFLLATNGFPKHPVHPFPILIACDEPYNGNEFPPSPSLYPRFLLDSEDLSVCSKSSHVTPTVGRENALEGFPIFQHGVHGYLNPVSPEGSFCGHEFQMHGYHNANIVDWGIYDGRPLPSPQPFNGYLTMLPPIGQTDVNNPPIGKCERCVRGSPDKRVHPLKNVEAKRLLPEELVRDMDDKGHCGVRRHSPRKCYSDHCLSKRNRFTHVTQYNSEEPAKVSIEIPRGGNTSQETCPCSFTKTPHLIGGTTTEVEAGKRQRNESRSQTNRKKSVSPTKRSGAQVVRDAPITNVIAPAAHSKQESSSSVPSKLDEEDTQLLGMKISLTKDNFPQHPEGSITFTGINIHNMMGLISSVVKKALSSEQVMGCSTESAPPPTSCNQDNRGMRCDTNKELVNSKVKVLELSQDENDVSQSLGARRPEGLSKCVSSTQTEDCLIVPQWTQCPQELLTPLPVPNPYFPNVPMPYCGSQISGENAQNVTSNQCFFMVPMPPNLPCFPPRYTSCEPRPTLQRAEAESGGSQTTKQQSSDSFNIPARHFIAKSSTVVCVSDPSLTPPTEASDSVPQVWKKITPDQDISMSSVILPDLGALSPSNDKSAVNYEDWHYTPELHNLSDVLKFCGTVTGSVPRGEPVEKSESPDTGDSETKPFSPEKKHRRKKAHKTKSRPKNEEESSLEPQDNPLSEP